MIDTLKHCDRVGVAIGLSWTPVGGKVQVIETSRYYPKNKTNHLVLTGLAGQTLKESVKIALCWIDSFVNKVNYLMITIIVLNKIKNQNLIKETLLNIEQIRYKHFRGSCSPSRRRSQKRWTICWDYYCLCINFSFLGNTFETNDCNDR